MNMGSTVGCLVASLGCNQKMPEVAPNYDSQNLSGPCQLSLRGQKSVLVKSHCSTLKKMEGKVDGCGGPG